MVKVANITEFLSLEPSFIIDVRSPREFAYSHIPNALNYPVLKDSEYEKIGTIYKQNSFNAKAMGASFVCQNIANHLLELKDILSPAKPFGIYCARGGMRSHSFYEVLKKIGYQVILLEGGYKAYRTEVLKYLNTPLKHRFITLIGQTGCGKSEIIHSFANSLDIESLARHFGSSFGGVLGAQPSMKYFYDLLFMHLRKLENAPFVLVEGESKKLGSLILPSLLYETYHKAEKILILSPLEDRIKRIIAQYGKISKEFFETSMQKIAPFMKKNFWEEAKSAFYAKNLEKVAEILLLEYYDKVYKKDSFSHSIMHTNIQNTLQEIQDFANTLK
ncbi:tRNA 2-selenouridine(34) synthase MnmH [Helicobacter burdigaliensis]